MSRRLLPCRASSPVRRPWRRPSAGAPRPAPWPGPIFAEASALSRRRQRRVGAPLEPFQIAQRRGERFRLARRRHGGFLRRGGGLDRLGGLSGKRLGARRRGRDGLRVRLQQRRVGKRDRRRVVRRDDHPHADMRLVEQLLGKAVGHPDAAVRGRIAGQRPAVQRDAVPGDALHVRHPGIVVHGRVVVLVLLDEGEDAGRRLAVLDAGRHRRAIDPAVGVVEGDLLRADRHDRQDRLAGRTRRRLRLDLRGARLGDRAGAQGRQRGHRRQRRQGGRPETADRRGELCRRQSMDHAKLSWIARLDAVRAV